MKSNKYPFRIRLPKFWIEGGCAVVKCRRQSDVVHLDTPLCDRHWVEYCEQDSDQETEKVKIKKHLKPGVCSAMRCKELTEEGKTGLLCARHREVSQSEEIIEEKLKPKKKVERLKKAVDQPDWQTKLSQETKELNESLELIKDFYIESEEDKQFAAESLSEIKNQWKALEKKRKSITKPMNAALKEANALFKPALSALSEMEEIWKRLLLEADQREEKEQERLIEQADEASTPKETQESLVKAAALRSKPNNISYRHTWSFRVVNPDALPREFLVPDQRKIWEVVRKNKEYTDIPGVEVFQTKSVACKST